MKKLLSLVLAVVLVVSIFTGCGKEDVASQSSSNQEASTDSATKNDSDENSKVEDKEQIKLVLNLGGFLKDPSVLAALEELQTLEKFSHIEFDILADDADYDTKMPITVASGEQVDIVGVFNSINRTRYAEAGTIQPMGAYIDSLGIDFEATFGSHTANSMIGDEVYIVPQRRSSWVLYYNKKVFDTAGVAYPDPEVPMTWDQYAEVAEQLTIGEGSEKTYGALHMTWPIFWYGEAIMALGGGEDFYNEDGLSNIENPVFAKALERTYNMMNVQKSIPSHADIVISKTAPTAFMNGQYGMMVSGSWILNWSLDKETYPRDWQLGIAPMPVDSGTTPKTWGDTRGYGISASAKYPEEAMAVAMELGRLGAKHAVSDPSSYQLEASPNLYVKAEEILGDEGITVELLKNTFAHPDTIFSVEKIMGPNNVDYDQIIQEEVGQYFVQEQDLESTIANIKERVDAVIQK